MSCPAADWTASLQSLGIDAVWLSPIFPSPMADFGYDISDYTGIDTLFGTMDDFDALIEAAYARAQVILDLVPNHTSDRHPWFVESRASRDAIFDVMRFWLTRGVDGFRVDVIWHLIKDADFRVNPHYVEGRPPHET